MRCTRYANDSPSTTTSTAIRSVDAFYDQLQRRNTLTKRRLRSSVHRLALVSARPPRRHSGVRARATHTSCASARAPWHRSDEQGAQRHRHAQSFGSARRGRVRTPRNVTQRERRVRVGSPRVIATLQLGGDVGGEVCDRAPSDPEIGVLRFEGVDQRLESSGRDALQR